MVLGAVQFEASMVYEHLSVLLHVSKTNEVKQYLLKEFVEKQEIQ